MNLHRPIQLVRLPMLGSRLRIFTAMGHGAIAVGDSLVRTVLLGIPSSGGGSG